MLHTPVRRFVGLLLAVRLLPQGGDAAIHQVIDALGWSFLRRLLLPLSNAAAAGGKPQGQKQQQQQQQQQQTELTCSLGLSILSAACRLPSLAASPHLLSLVPALVGVVAHGGVGQLLGLASPPPPAPSSSPLSAAQQQAAAAALSSTCEALECLVAAGQEGGPGARNAMLQVCACMGHRRGWFSAAWGRPV